MRKDLKSQTWMMPMPVAMIGTYDENGKANLMNAAWAGIYDYGKIMICLSAHKSTENIKKNKAFTVSFATKKTMVASDYVGIVSANKVPDKVEKAGFHVIKSSKVNAPLFEEYPLTLECELVEVINEGEGGGNFIGQIVNVSVDEKALKDGKLDVDSIGFISYDPVALKYRLVGEVVGNAFTEGKKIK